MESIREDLACPDCDYNLRGLTGDVVNCPECGRVCDVAALVTARWTGKWYRAPGLNALLIPTAVAVIGGLASFIGLIYGEMQDPYADRSNAWPLAVLALTMLVWVWRMVVTASKFAQSMRGPALALLAHVLFAGYLGGLIFFLSGLVSFIFGLIETGLSGVGIGLVMLIGSVAVMWGCRWGEKYIASCCIREYLRRQSRVG